MFFGAAAAYLRFDYVFRVPPLVTPDESPKKLI